ncbi:MAG: TIGR03619 family F420-dependent LLM class oxidoreductase, partial [Gammaproteobacteria bacterium]
TLMSFIAAVTAKIELVPSVIILPLRQTALLAKQAVELDILANGRLRLGIGVGSNEHEYEMMNQDFKTRGARCDEQMRLLKMLWSEPSVEFNGRWDNIKGAGLNPLPLQRPIPMWIGAQSAPARSVVKRIGTYADGWFVLCSPEQFPELDAQIKEQAQSVGRDASEIGTEAGVAVVGPRQADWQDRVRGWREIGLTHLCLRTLGGELNVEQHLDKLREVVGEIPAEA